MKEQNTTVKPLGIPYGMMNRRTKQEQNQACLSYALQEGGRTTDRLSNFVAICEDNYYYGDKTRFIEKIENSNRYFLIRPRRFGKSLTMSMLHPSYDINAADKFERLYGDLYIGKNPTPNHNKYLVINLNFAVINADLGNYRSALDAHCNTRFNSFCDQYAAYVHGYTLALTSLCRFYRPISDLDNQNGYADIFLRQRPAANRHNHAPQGVCGISRRGDGGVRRDKFQLTLN